MATNDYFGELMEILNGSGTPEQEEADDSFGKLIELMYGNEPTEQEEADDSFGKFIELMYGSEPIEQEEADDSLSKPKEIFYEDEDQSQEKSCDYDVPIYNVNPFQTDEEDEDYFASLMDTLDMMFGTHDDEEDWMKYDVQSLSQKAGLLMEGERQVDFKLHRIDEDEKPSVDECKGKICLVYLGYAFMGEQDFGIDDLREKFGIQKGETLIRKIPKDLKVIEKDGVKAIKSGHYVDLDEMMVKATLQAGLAGTWDDEAFIICASNEYSFLIDYIVEKLKPGEAKIGLSYNFFGPNFVIQFD